MKQKAISRRRALLGMSALAAAGCKPQTHGRSPSAMRLVSLAPNMTEIIFAVGRGEWLVGRTRYCDYPPETKRIPVVGGFADPSFETILGLSPDLVVGARGPSSERMAQELHKHGIATLFPSTNSIAQIEGAILRVGKAIHALQRATGVVNTMHRQLAAIESAVRPFPKLRTLLVFGHKPLIVCGPGTFPNEMLSLAGARNVVQEGPRYPTLSPETVLKYDPDVIIDAAYGGAGLEKLPGLSGVRAVQNGRIVRLSDSAVLRPGPRVPKGIVRLAKAVHPTVEIHL